MLDVFMIIFGIILFRYMVYDNTNSYLAFVGFLGFLVCLYMFLGQVYNSN